jgi:hypothetical protein
VNIKPIKSRIALPIVLLILLAGGVTVLLGCKQGEGERCQVNSDCESGLQCNQGTKPPSCQKTVGGGVAATVPDFDIDAPPVDAIDAPDA